MTAPSRAPAGQRRLIVPPRVVLGVGSVAIVAVVVVAAAALAPDGARPWLLLSGVLAVVAAVQGVASDPRDLATALLLSLPPVIALVADGSPTWLIGPLGALLLVAGELNALSWECQVARPIGPVKRRRLLATGQLASIGVAASLAVGVVARGPWPGGTATAVVAAAALAALGGVVFRRGGSPSPPVSVPPKRPHRPGAAPPRWPGRSPP